MIKIPCPAILHKHVTHMFHHTLEASSDFFVLFCVRRNDEGCHGIGMTDYAQKKCASECNHKT
jgi:hypothetical protein